MVPVRLELQNFLSYGTAAPPLDFNEFDVACLSGGNGEGKSALLDAMTWALWGEARKSSGKRKPDDELIRIGTRHMEVAFTFELEDTRYRATRSFSRSATGKTTYSDLEFHLYNPTADTFRPLTGSTQRETQSRIEETLGLDYSTFINSAFLLQGRSDEFTNKSPSQRKEILVSILNLSRYEALEDKARDRWREAKQRRQRVEADVERLQDAIADVPEWKEERETLRANLTEKRETITALRDKEKALTQELANLEAKSREIDSVRASIEDLDERITDQEELLQALEERMAEADELLSKSDDITATHERFLELREERDTLDEKRDLHRGVEKQLEQARATLRERTNKLERRLDRLTVERKSFKKDLHECESTLATRSALEQNLREAQAARQRVRELSEVRDRRRDLESQKEDAKRAILGARQQIQGEIERLQGQIEDERESVAKLEELEARIERLEERKAERERLQEEMESVEDRGTKVGQQIQEVKGQFEARRKEWEQEQAELQRFRAADGPTCPTCGTELTPEHREEVEITFGKSLDDLESDIQAWEERLDKLETRRSELRETYTQLRTDLEKHEGVAEALATAREQHRSLTERAEALDTHTEQIDRLQSRLDEQCYAEEHRHRWQWCVQRRAELQFDPRRFESLQNDAAQLDRFTERLHELNELEGRREELERKIRQHDEEIESIRTTLDDGSAFEDVQERIQQLETQLGNIDFDPERFQAVRDELNELADVQDRISDLRHARNNRDEWAEQHRRIDDRLDDLRDERVEQKEKLAALHEEVEGVEALREQILEVERQLDEAESAMNETQQALGKLNERLEQAARDREALKEAKDNLQNCKHNQHLYKHLRTAFGKHGIPSLIIEETLPEIEERANRILGRLTDGRMHVRLETLKEKKSGGTKETLDIIITDEQGVARPYETYSGGESFRVNFALRVALAQLLAERSGVRVRTLVIDEGFGTQDEEGIQRLVEAIQSIRQDFAKILVITHLQRLKEAFPVRIEVDKDPAIGSTYQLVGA